MDAVARPVPPYASTAASTADESEASDATARLKPDFFTEVFKLEGARTELFAAVDYDGDGSYSVATPVSKL